MFFSQFHLRRSMIALAIGAVCVMISTPAVSGLSNSTKTNSNSLTLQAESSPSAKPISAQDLIDNRDTYVLLDVRTSGEYVLGHIDGAINISHWDIASEIDYIATIDKPIVIYCRSGKRAKLAEDVLIKHGITNILHLEGDMLGWQKQGFPTVTGF